MGIISVWGALFLCFWISGLFVLLLRALASLHVYYVIEEASMWLDITSHTRQVKAGRKGEERERGWHK